MMINILDGLYNPFYLSISMFIFLEIITIQIEFITLYIINDWIINKISLGDIVKIVIIMNICSALFGSMIWSMMY